VADPADERAAYREALARAEAAATEFVEQTPVLPEGAVEVIASDLQPVETSEVAEETPAEPEAEAVSEAQLREQIAALEARLAEKDTFIGRQSSEVGELREAINSLSQRVDSRAEPTYQAPPLVITQDFIDNDPAGATILAFEQKNERALAAAYEAWKQEDPANASVWLAEERFKERENALRAELEATRATVNTIATSNQEAAKQAEVNKQWKDAYTAVEADRPGFLENAERLLNEVAPQFPDAIEALATGSAKAKAEILKLLYDHDRAVNTNPETVRAQLEEAAAEATAEANTSRQLAAVVGGQTTAGRDGVTLTYEQQEIERAKTRIGGGVDIRKNWTGRTS
jgi:hypothetical protein